MMEGCYALHRYNYPPGCNNTGSIRMNKYIKLKCENAKIANSVQAKVRIIAKIESTDFVNALIEKALQNELKRRGVEVLK